MIVVFVSQIGALSDCGNYYGPFCDMQQARRWASEHVDTTKDTWRSECLHQPEFSDRQRITQWLEYHNLSFNDIDIDIEEGTSLSNLTNSQVAELMEMVYEDHAHDTADGHNPTY